MNSCCITVIASGRTWMLLWIGMVTVLLPRSLKGQVQVVSEPMSVFGGSQRELKVRVRNPTGELLEADVHTRMMETSSATAAPAGISESSKKWRVLPGQTVIESAKVTFPSVRAATRFLVQWLDAQDGNLGVTVIAVFPTNLFSELRSLAGGKPVGLLDPMNQLKPLLRESQIEVEDLEKRDLEFFDGALAILGPFASARQMPPNLAKSVRDRAQSGVAIVWIQPPGWLEEGRAQEPGSYLVRVDPGAVFIADPGAVAGLNDNPQARLNLVRFARLALKMDPLKLPNY
jgi:hypothetical protein